MLLDK
jgi:hypothetical protein